MDGNSTPLARPLAESSLIPATSTFDLIDELSRLAGEPVELLERSLHSAPVFMIVPVSRTRRTAPFWRAVQADSTGGFWGTAEQAVVGFAAGAATWVAKAALEAATGLPEALRARLQAGPQLAADVLAAFAADGILRDRVSRAARRMGVQRWKGSSMTSGWIWALPQGGKEGAESANTATLEEQHV